MTIQYSRGVWMPMRIRFSFCSRTNASQRIWPFSDFLILELSPPPSLRVSMLGSWLC